MRDHAVALCRIENIRCIRAETDCVNPNIFVLCYGGNFARQFRVGILFGAILLFCLAVANTHSTAVQSANRGDERESHNVSSQFGRVSQHSAKCGVSDSSDGFDCTPLMAAAERGQADKMRDLIKQGANVNEELNSGYTALILAAMSGHLAAVELLLNAGADPNTTVVSFHGGAAPALAAALKPENKDWLKILDAMIAAGGELNPKQFSRIPPLIFALLWHYDKQIIKALISRGADVNYRLANGATPLMVASSSGYGVDESLIRLLIEAGADAKAKDKNGKTARNHIEDKQNERPSQEGRRIIKLLKSLESK